MADEKNAKSDKTEKTEKKKKPEGEFDIFIAESIYPEAEQIFTARLKSLDEIKDDCFVVLDTNSLLVPYAIGKKSLQQIRETYSKLATDKRIIVPGQVAREFAKNRANKLTELYQQFNRKISNISKLQKGRYPLLESFSAYEKTVRLEQRIDKLMADYKKAVQSILEHIHEWTWNDPISLLYADLFKGDVILDLKVDKEKVFAELTRRQLHSIPPGYKDIGKDDSGIGDFLIWMTILEVGKQHKKSMLFVSGEEKPDWFHRSEGRALYPRYELVDEYRRHSDGQAFHMVSFAQFLNIYGASESIVEEVREEEKKLNLELTVVGEFIRKWIEFEQALYEKCNEVSPQEITPRRATPFRMLQILQTHEAVPSHFYHMAREMTDLRNRVVHGQIDVPLGVIRDAISTIDELMDEL
jgi:uncharacterized protein YutE (UPF0331/DUF86 family)/rRNA-processing protein FCF1